jgi:hypothetical protein
MGNKKPGAEKNHSLSSGIFSKSVSNFAERVDYIKTGATTSRQNMLFFEYSGKEWENF